MSIPDFDFFQWSLDQKSLLFRWNHIALPILNGLMRIIKHNIPSVAFNETEILENTTLYPNEFIDHRIQLFPIQQKTQKEIVPVTDCVCVERKCNRCTVKCELKVRNKSQKPQIVWSHQLLCTDESFQLTPLPDIPLIELNPDQSLHIHAFINSGIAESHAKFSVVSKSTFIRQTQITCPTQYELSLKNTSDAEYDYDVIIESLGTWKPEDILDKSFTLLENKLKELLVFLELE